MTAANRPPLGEWRVREATTVYCTRPCSRVTAESPCPGHHLILRYHDYFDTYQLQKGGKTVNLSPDELPTALDMLTRAYQDRPDTEETR